MLPCNVNTVFIYMLSDPDTGDVRYVGKTKDREARLKVHAAGGKEQNYRGNLLRSFRVQGIKPYLTTLDEVPENEWPMWEAAYIQFFREQGCNLVNTTSGGEGVEQTPEIRAKIGNGNRGRKFGPEIVERMRLRMLGRTHSDETKAKMSEAHKGYVKSPEHCANLSAALKGNSCSVGAVRSNESRVNYSAVKKGEKNPNFGKTMSSEVREKISAGIRAFHARRRAQIER